MAAGLGFKTFTTGEVLTAADVNGYLMQGILVFANAAARTSAITSPQEGQYSFLKDTNALEYYDGAAWVGAPVGDITAVTAGTGISGGGSSGAVTITNDMATTITASGDIVVGTGSGTYDNLPIGSTGQVLTADTTVSPYKVKWAAASAGVNKNYLINGGFAISQRGTSFTSTGGANNDDSYTLDRWYILSDTNDVIDVTQDTTTVPTNGQFAIALDVETVNKKFGIATIIENKDVIGLVGNTVTFSFKAKVSSTTKLDNVKAAIVAWSGTADTVTSDIISAWNVEGTNPTLIANATYENTPANLNLTTSYATYSVSAAVDTASTKNIILFVWSDVTDTTLGDFLYIAEAKLELGSSATAFQYAGGTIAGELDACQRYFWKQTGGHNTAYGQGQAQTTTALFAQINLPVNLRTKAPVLGYASLRGTDYNAAVQFSAVVIYTTTGGAGSVATNNLIVLQMTVLGPAQATQFRPYQIVNDDTTAGYLQFDAEL